MQPSTDLLALIGRNVPLKKIANTYGGEWAGACPLCNAGVDRLRVWPNADRPSWWCRHCNKGGDAIQYLREHDGLGYHDACTQLGLPIEHLSAAPMEPMPPEPCEPPSEEWRITADRFVIWSQHASRVAVARPYLVERGLTEETIFKAGLGYNPEGRWSERSKWGLPIDRDGNERLWLPAGIVIPWYAGGVLWKVIVRRDTVRDDQDRYKTLTGSSNALYNVDALRPDRPAMLVEGFFDALSVQQEAGDKVAAVACGTSGARRIRWITQLACCSEVLVALDADEAGDTASNYWLGVLPGSRRLRPYYSDPSQMLQDGQDVRGWALGGIDGRPTPAPEYTPPPAAPVPDFDTQAAAPEDPDPLFVASARTTVVNIKSGAAYDVYIGRANERYGLAASKWANPFRLTNEADRGLVLARYRIWLHTQPRLLADIHELRDKVLCCFCAPALCHGDYLAELANAPERERRARVGATWASPLIEAYWRDEARRGSPSMGRLITICRDLGWHYPTVVEELMR